MAKNIQQPGSVVVESVGGSHDVNGQGEVR